MARFGGNSEKVRLATPGRTKPNLICFIACFLRGYTCNPSLLTGARHRRLEAGIVDLGIGLRNQLLCSLDVGDFPVDKCDLHIGVEIYPLCSYRRDPGRIAQHCPHLIHCLTDDYFARIGTRAPRGDQKRNIDQQGLAGPLRDPKYSLRQRRTRCERRASFFGDCLLLSRPAFPAPPIISYRSD